MNKNRRFSGTLSAVYANWPTFAIIYSGIILMLLIIGFSAQGGWIGLILLSLAALIILTFILITSLWQAYLQYDRDGLVPHHILFDMGQIRAADSIVVIDLGLRYRAIELARRLTTGKAVIIDVYNPQLTPSRALWRYRTRMSSASTDPRISWRDGQSRLLPLPDKSVSAVILCQVVSELWQEGDRLQLLHEVYRILSENGRLLFAEQVRTRSNWLFVGPTALTLSPAEYWHDLLEKAGFRVRQTKQLQDIIYCLRADKPTFAEAHQLPLDLVDQ